MTKAIAFFNCVILIVPLLWQFFVGFFCFLIGKLFSDKLRKYGFNMLLSVDQNANVVLMGFPDETISSRVGRAVASGRPKWYIRIFAPILNLAFKVIAGDKNHAIESIEHDENFNDRAELWSWAKADHKTKQEA